MLNFKFVIASLLDLTLQFFAVNIKKRKRLEQLTRRNKKITQKKNDAVQMITNQKQEK